MCQNVIGVFTVRNHTLASSGSGETLYLGLPMLSTYTAYVRAEQKSWPEEEFDSHLGLVINGSLDVLGRVTLYELHSNAELLQKNYAITR